MADMPQALQLYQCGDIGEEQLQLDLCLWQIEDTCQGFAVEFELGSVALGGDFQLIESV